VENAYSLNVIASKLEGFLFSLTTNS